MISPNWSNFHSFSQDHALALAWTLPLIILPCILGRRFLARSQAAKEQALATAAALAILALSAWSLAYQFTRSPFDPKRHLPLEMCDIALLLAPFALLPRLLSPTPAPTHAPNLPAFPPHRIPRALLYFWGLGLCTQAFVSPILEEGPSTQRYWLFWLGHTAIVGAAVYDLSVRRFRPSLRDLLTTIAITTAWFIAVGLLNIQVGSNYGFNGSAGSPRPTLIDFLGPWPQRAILLGLIAAAWLSILWLLWPLAARMRHPRPVRAS